MRLFLLKCSYIQKLDSKNSIYIELLVRISMNRCDACGKVLIEERIRVHIDAHWGLLPKSSISTAVVCADEGCVRLFLEWD